MTDERGTEVSPTDASEAPMTSERGTNETPHTPTPSPSPEDVRGLIREGRDTADRMDAAEERDPYPGQVGHATMVRRLTDALESVEREREIDRLNQNATIRGLVQAATDVISERKAAEARVQELERERDQISVDQQIAQGERCARIHADAIAYKARAERAEAALRRYGSHDEDCPPIILPTDRCICGLAELLNNLSTGEAPAEPPSTIA